MEGLGQAERLQRGITGMRCASQAQVSGLQPALRLNPRLSQHGSEALRKPKHLKKMLRSPEVSSGDLALRREDTANSELALLPRRSGCQ